MNPDEMFVPVSIDVLFELICLVPFVFVLEGRCWIWVFF